MTETKALNQSGTLSTGDDLYGLSLHELEARIIAFRAEITRVETELTKKKVERNAADSLFGSKN